MYKNRDDVIELPQVFRLDPEGFRKGRTMQTTESVIALKPARVTMTLASIVALLVLANIAVQISRYLLGFPELFGLVHQFDMNDEGNIPTYFSGCMLLLATTLLAIIAHHAWRTRARFAAQWAVLAAVFFYLSADEMAELHELAGSNLARLVGIFDVRAYYVWVIPVVGLLFLFSALYLPFLMHLKPAFSLRFVLAGAIYVSGALGVEIISGWHAVERGIYNFQHAMIYTVEEAAEMLGIVLLIYALLLYLREYVGLLSIRFSGE
jgi:hypothetical protein